MGMRKGVLQAIGAACWVVGFGLAIASAAGVKDPGTRRSLRRERFASDRHWRCAIASVVFGWLGFLALGCSLAVPD